jgi:hypothetical protein
MKLAARVNYEHLREVAPSSDTIASELNRKNVLHVAGSTPMKKIALRRELPALGPTPQIIARIPRPYPSQQEFGALITSELANIWVSVLTEAERVRFASNELSVNYEKLDALILKQAETFGWRLSLSEMVQRRFSEWDLLPDGPDRFERFGKACARSARIFQKIERPPIDDPDLRRVKAETVGELRLLLKTLRGVFSVRRTKLTMAAILQRFAAAVAEEPDTFRYLHTNLESWLMFFETNALSIKALAFGQRPSPATMFDSWLAWSKGHDADSIRQHLSRISKK